MAFQSNQAKRVQVGQNLCTARRLAELTQSDVMVRVFNVNNPNQKNRISEIESGKVAPDAEVLQELCLLYSVSSDWVLGLPSEQGLIEF